MLQRAQFVKNAAEGPHVTLVGVRLALADFGRHVVWGSLDGEGLVVRVFQNFANAEVAELDGVVAREKNVLRLQIAVQNVALMHVLEGEAHLNEPVHDFGFAKVFVFGALLLDVVRQVAHYTQIEIGWECTYFRRTP